MKKLKYLFLSILFSQFSIAGTPQQQSTDILIRTEGRNDVEKALATSVDSSAKEARQEKLSNNAVIFRRNAIPAKIILSSETAQFAELPLTTLIIESDEQRDNDVFRDIFEAYSSQSKGVTYTTLLTRKDNWIRGNQKIMVGTSNAAYAHTTVFQRLFPSTSGTGFVTGELFRKKDKEIACDLVEEDDNVSGKTLCIQDGAKMSIGDTIGAWAKVNKAQKVRIYFEHRGITIPTFKRYYNKLLNMEDVSVTIVDINNKELFQMNSHDLKLHFVRLDDRAGKPWVNLNTLPDDDPNLFNLKVWFDSSNFQLPCLCSNPQICDKDKKDNKDNNQK